MDYSKITLANERNEHVTKRLNRLSTWGFFKVLYRDNMFRLFGFSMLMVLLVVPIIFMMFRGASTTGTMQQTLPILNELGFSTGAWSGVSDVYQQNVRSINDETVLFCCLCGLALSIMFSGGFAVIRDAFWTGKLSEVGVFRSLWLGIKSGFLYALLTSAVAGGIVCGLYFFYMWSVTVMPLWLAIVLLVLLSLVGLLVLTYFFILCSVAVTYNQSVGKTFDDAWRLLWLNILPNVIHLVIALLPIPLYFMFSGLASILLSIYMVLLLMFGGMFFPLVWQTHMMKTFALFHPVEARKKNGKGGAKQPTQPAPATVE